MKITRRSRKSLFVVCLMHLVSSINQRVGCPLHKKNINRRCTFGMSQIVSKAICGLEPSQPRLRAINQDAVTGATTPNFYPCLSIRFPQFRCRNPHRFAIAHDNNSSISLNHGQPRGAWQQANRACQRVWFSKDRVWSWSFSNHTASLRTRWI